MSHPTADHSVRVAWADDAPAIAAVQAAAWRASYGDLLPAEMVNLDVEQAAAVWRDALVTPGDARNRVLVALDRATIVGFAVTTPATDPDCDPVAVAEVSELAVVESAQRQGHGSRLMQAAVDTMVADRFTEAVLWLRATDEAARAWLEQAGWAPDTAHRELGLDGSGGATLKQVRLHTAFGDM